jgi:hypothetical protein
MPLDVDRSSAPLTQADRLNGQVERFEFRWSTPSYRSWDNRVRSWTPWQTGRGTNKDKVVLLKTTATLMSNGQWRLEEEYYIQVNGEFVRPDCGELPGGYGPVRRLLISPRRVSRHPRRMELRQPSLVPGLRRGGTSANGGNRPRRVG